MTDHLFTIGLDFQLQNLSQQQAQIRNFFRTISDAGQQAQRSSGASPAAGAAGPTRTPPPLNTPGAQPLIQQVSQARIAAEAQIRQGLQSGGIDTRQAGQLRAEATRAARQVLTDMGYSAKSIDSALKEGVGLILRSTQAAKALAARITNESTSMGRGGRGGGGQPPTNPPAPGSPPPPEPNRPPTVGAGFSGAPIFDSEYAGRRADSAANAAQGEAELLASQQYIRTLRALTIIRQQQREVIQAELAANRAYIASLARTAVSRAQQNAGVQNQLANSGDYNQARADIDSAKARQNAARDALIVRQAELALAQADEALARVRRRTATERRANQNPTRGRDDVDLQNQQDLRRTNRANSTNGSDTGVRVDRLEAERVTQLRAEIERERRRATGDNTELRLQAELNRLRTQRTAQEREATRQAAIQANGGSLVGPGGSAIQRLQAYTRSRNSGDVVDPTREQNLGQIFASRAITTASYGAAGALLYGGVETIKEMTQQALELDRVFATIRSQFREADDEAEFPKFRASMLAISRDTGVAAQEVATVGFQMAGAFGVGTEAIERTDQAIKASIVTGISQKELTDSLTGAAITYGQSIEGVTDKAIGLEQRFGVLAKESLKVFGDLAPTAYEAGLSFESLGAIVGVVQQRSGRSGAAIAESFGRILPALSQNTGQILGLYQQLEKRDPSENISKSAAAIQNFAATGQTGEVLTQLIRDWDMLDTSTKQYVVTLLGGRREAQTLIPLFGGTSDIIAELDRTQSDAGRTAQRFADIQGTLQNQLSRARQEFVQLGDSLARAGLLDTLKLMASALLLIMQIIGDAARKFADFNEATDGIAGHLLSIVVALKALQSASVALAAFRGASVAATGLATASAAAAGVSTAAAGAATAGAAAGAGATGAAGLGSAGLLATLFGGGLLGRGQEQAARRAAAAARAAEIESRVAARRGNLGQGSLFGAGAGGIRTNNVTGQGRLFGDSVGRAGLNPGEQRAIRTGVVDAVRSGARTGFAGVGRLFVGVLELGLLRAFAGPVSTSLAIAIASKIAPNASGAAIAGGAGLLNLAAITGVVVAGTIAIREFQKTRSEYAQIAKDTRAGLEDNSLQQLQQQAKTAPNVNQVAGAKTNPFDLGTYTPANRYRQLQALGAQATGAISPKDLVKDQLDKTTQEQFQEALNKKLIPTTDDNKKLLKDLEQGKGGDKTGEKARAIINAQTQATKDALNKFSSDQAAINSLVADSGQSVIQSLQEMQSGYQSGRTSYTQLTGSLTAQLNGFRAAFAQGPGSPELRQAFDQLQSQYDALVQERFKKYSDGATLLSSFGLDPNIAVITATKQAQSIIADANVSEPAKQTAAQQYVQFLQQQRAQAASVAPNATEAQRIMSQPIELDDATRQKLADLIGVTVDQIPKSIAATAEEMRSSMQASLNARLSAENADFQEGRFKLSGRALNPQSAGDQAAFARAQAQTSLEAANAMPAGQAREDAINAARVSATQADQQAASAAAATARAKFEYYGALAGGDPVKEANNALAQANDSLKRAKNADERYSALASQIQAKQQQADAALDIKRAQNELLGAQNPDDLLAQAQLAQKDADLDAQAAKGKAAEIRALAAKTKADRQVKDALSQIAAAESQLIQARLDAVDDTVGSAQEGLNEARRKLDEARANGAGREVIAPLEAGVVQAENGVRKASLQQIEDSIEFDLQMGLITNEAAIARYRAAMAMMDPKEQQETLLKIHQLEQQASGAGLQFNLPTTLGLPTLYQARRATQESGAGDRQYSSTAGSTTNVDNRNIQIILNADNAIDGQAALQTVVDALNEQPRYGNQPRTY